MTPAAEPHFRTALEGMDSPASAPTPDRPPHCWRRALPLAQGRIDEADRYAAERNGLPATI